MTRDEAFEVLQVRWRLLGTRFDRDTPQLWAEALGDIDYQRARHKMIDLCRQSPKVTLAELSQALTPQAQRPYDLEFVWTPELEAHRHYDPNYLPGRANSVYADHVRAEMAAHGSSEYAQRIRDERAQHQTDDQP